METVQGKLAASTLDSLLNHKDSQGRVSRRAGPAGEQTPDLTVCFWPVSQTGSLQELDQQLKSRRVNVPSFYPTVGSTDSYLVVQVLGFCLHFL